MKFITLLIAFVSLIGMSTAQINITPPSEKLTIEQIIQSIEGEGIIVQNITTNQEPTTNQLAQFKDEQLFTGMEGGTLLSTGSVKQISGANKSTGMTGSIAGAGGVNANAFAITACYPEDIDIASQSVLSVIKPYYSDSIVTQVIPVYKQGSIGESNPTSNNAVVNNFGHFNPKKSIDEDMQAELKGKFTLFDACIVEMDIIPLGDTLSFRYMFASEEYDEYVGTQFNDAFAFFISGPGIEEKKNLAVLESGDRVTVNSINNGNPGNRTLKPSNPSFYNRNTGQIPLEYDGFTRTLEIVEPVIAFETYHLKIIIVDAGDGALDSGVFIEDGSVISYDYKYVIPFDTDISNLDDKARNILLSMMQIATDHPEYVLQITGHTDSDGSEASNLILAKDRINSVVDFVGQEGFSEDDIFTINKGESMPMTTNETAEGKKQNRRVEIKLIPSDHESFSVTTSHTELTNYPNPARTSTTIEVTSNEDFDGATIVIFSTNGELIAEQELENSKSTFDSSEWDAGVYFYSLKSDGKNIASSRLVVVN